MVPAMLTNGVISKQFYDWLEVNGFFTAPASTKYHGAFEGGLYEHSKAVAKELIKLTDRLGLIWQRPESPSIVGIFHDLCKIDQYKLNESGNYDYNKDMLLTGHGDKSIILLSQFMTLTEEEIMCIRYHMGAYVKEDWHSFDVAIKKYPNVLYTHTADMIASKLYV